MTLPRYRTAIVAPLVLLIATVAWAASRDIAVFFLGGIFLVAQGTAAVAFLVVAVHRRAAPHIVGTGLLLLIATPFSGYAMIHRRDPLAFALWTLTYPGSIAAHGGGDAIIRNWDSWGFAGLENDSYLVRDSRDAAGTIIGAEAWRRRLHLRCEVVATARMSQNLYIVTTSNCTF